MANTFNFKKLRDYPIDINSFNYDVTDMIDSVYIGPQGELLESIDAFNQRYDTSLEVTKHFTLKPGGYDKLKKAYSNWVLRWDMRPRGIESIFNRIAEYRWRSQTMKDDAIRIENQMLSLRTTGIRWQDNTEDFVQETDKLRDIIISAVESCKKLYPNVDVSVKIIPSLTGRLSPQLQSNRNYNSTGRQSFPELGNPELENPSEYIIAFYVHMKNPEMTVHILTDGEDIDKCTFPCHDIVVASGTYLLPMISRNWGRSTLRSDDVPSRSYSYFLDTMYLSPYGINLHPYIGSSTDLYTWELNQYTGHYTNICTGNMNNEIRNTLLNSQIEAHITYLVTWLTNYYIPQTNPLNRIVCMRKIGKDTTFLTYAESGHSTFDNTLSPSDCSLGTSISNSIDTHSTNNVTGYYSNNFIFSRGDPEYLVRKEDYINHIKMSDLPCNSCTWLNHCSQQTNIFTFLQEKSYTPMEEAYIGMFWEISEYDNFTRPFVNRPRRSPRRYDFIEEAIKFSDYRNPSNFYDIILESNICVKRWFFVNNEELNLSWSNERFLSRFSAIMRMSDSNRKGLLEHVLDENSEFVWTMDNIENFRAKRIRRSDCSGSIPPISDTFTTPEFEEAVEILNEAEITGDLTSEQRTLRWATTMGGSTNL